MARTMRTWTLLLALLTSPCAWAAHSDFGCLNCHVAHDATRESEDPSASGVPLWSNKSLEDTGGLQATVFVLYASATFDAATSVTQPDGSSKMCLGCHDGTFPGIGAHEGEDGNFGSSLENDHPISFVYDTSLAMNDLKLEDPSAASSRIMTGTPSTIQADLLDGNGKLQCTSCHDVHGSGITENQLRWNINSPYESSDPGIGEQGMCRVCHKQ